MRKHAITSNFNCVVTSTCGCKSERASSENMKTKITLAFLYVESVTHSSCPKLLALPAGIWSKLLSSYKISNGKIQPTSWSIHSPEVVTTRLQRQRHKICILNCKKQKFCTPFTYLFQFRAFLSSSRQICDVK